MTESYAILVTVRYICVLSFTNYHCNQWVFIVCAIKNIEA